MADAYVGQIRMFGGPNAPQGWMFCDGTELKISEYKQLYQKLQTTYGGDGETTFALPDMRARLPVGQGDGPGLTARPLGKQGGLAQVQIKPENMPQHTHQFRANALDADTNAPAAQAPAAGATNPSNRIYSTNGPTVDMSTEAVAAAGENQPHSNLMWSLCVNFIIAVEPRSNTSSGGYFLSDPFIGEIRIFPYQQDGPDGWVLCSCLQSDSARLSRLKAVLGGHFKNRETENIKELKKRNERFLSWMPYFNGHAPMHPGEILSDETLQLGQKTGRPLTHLHSDDGNGYFLPTHTHQLRGNNSRKGAQSSNNPQGNVFGFSRFQGTTNNNVYSQGMPDTTLQEGIFSFPADNTDPKPNVYRAIENMQPYLTFNFYIAYQGINP